VGAIHFFASSMPGLIRFLRTSAHLLFPVMPTLALYVLGIQDQDRDCEVGPSVKIPGIDSTSNASGPRHDSGAVWVDVGIESRSDVHLRNASLLQRNPTRLYFSSLTSLVQALANYDECRWIPEHLDYSRLKQRARQKALQEGVAKTLLVKGNVLLVDLTDEVRKVGQDPVCHGGFSDVWKGVWTSAVGQSRTVRLSVLWMAVVIAICAQRVRVDRWHSSFFDSIRAWRMTCARSS